MFFVESYVDIFLSISLFDSGDYHYTPDKTLPALNAMSQSEEV